MQPQENINKARKQPKKQEDRRTLTAEVVKMRGTNHSWALAPYEITSGGFNIYTVDQMGEIP